MTPPRPGQLDDVAIEGVHVGDRLYFVSDDESRPGSTRTVAVKTSERRVASDAVSGWRLGFVGGTAGWWPRGARLKRWRAPAPPLG